LYRKPTDEEPQPEQATPTIELGSLQFNWIGLLDRQANSS
jgi:hypothetical protein